METNQQNTPQICWNRVTVTELKFTKNQWRTDRLLWKGTQGYGGDDWGDWEQWAQCSYQGQPHSSHQQPPDMILYGGSYLRWWNGREEKVQSTADPKNGQFRHMSGPRQTSHVHIGYTHTQMDKHNDSPRRNLSVTAENLGHSITTLAQSKIHLIKIGSVQFYSNGISQQWQLSSWLTGHRDTCDCCSFTLTGVCT